MLDGLLTFFASHHAIRAEKILHDRGFPAELIPGPKELSPNCGTAVRFEYHRRDEALTTLGAAHVEVDEVHAYVPRSEGWRETRRLFGRSR